MTLSRPRRTLDAGGGSDEGRSGTGAISGSCLGLGFHRNSIKGTVGRLWEHEELLRRPGMWESPGIVPADPAMLCLYPFDEHQSYFGLHQEQAPLFPRSLPTLRRKFCKAKTSLRVKPASGSEVQGSPAGVSDNAGLSRRLHERGSVCLRCFSALARRQERSFCQRRLQPCRTFGFPPFTHRQTGCRLFWTWCGCEEEKEKFGWRMVNSCSAGPRASALQLFLPLLFSLRRLPSGARARWSLSPAPL